METKKFAHREVEFEFTTSSRKGRFNMCNENYTYNNIYNSLPETIAVEFSKILTNTLKAMELNEATKLTMSWKWE